jgi:hypothetical protein
VEQRLGAYPPALLPVKPILQVSGGLPAFAEINTMACLVICAVVLDALCSLLFSEIESGFLLYDGH